MGAADWQYSWRFLTPEGRIIMMPDALQTGHLKKLLTEIGLWQHTQGDQPHARHGYSIDDEARGLIVGLRYWQTGTEVEFSKRLAETCFHFLQNATITAGRNEGRYHNFCDAQGKWLDSVGSDDSFGRTLWGLGVAAAVDAPFAPRSSAETLLRRSLPRIDSMQANFLRAKAFVILGLAASRVDDGRLCEQATLLAEAYDATAEHNWHWFEEQMTYCNARLPQALFAAAEFLPNPDHFLRIATDSLDFLLQATRNDKGSFNPIGNAPMEFDGWFKHGQARPPLFDQQPVDAGALVEACVAAWSATGELRFRQAALEAFSWYLGSNVHGLPVYDSVTGGVADAVTREGISSNQGAESVLSIHLAFQALSALENIQ